MKTANKIFLVVFILLIIMAAAIAFSGCTVIKKAKSVTRTEVDSSSVARVDSSRTVSETAVSVQKDNSVTVTETQDDYKKETVIEFGTSDSSNNPVFVKDYKAFGTPANDYFPADFRQPVKRITIRETGVKKEKIAVAANKSDSSTLSKMETVDFTKTVATDLHKTETVKTKEKEATSYWGWLWLVLIAAAAVYVCWRFGVFKWFAALFKIDDEYPIKRKA